MTKKELQEIVKQQKEQIDKLIKITEDLSGKLLQQPVQTIRVLGPNDDVCIDGGPHDWPSTWHGIIPPACTKCGKQAKMLTPTWTTGTTTTDTVTINQADSNSASSYTLKPENLKVQA